jgi:anti-sigma B factor antagonist
MNIQVRNVRSVTVLDVQGDIVGGPECENMRTVVRDLLDQGKRDILLNLRGVRLINSCGIGIIIGALVTLRKSDGRLKIAGFNERIRGTFDIIRLPLIIDLFDDEAAAIDSFFQKAAE